MNKDYLNDNDNKVLAYCLNRRRHLSDISEHIGISVKNVSTRIPKLKRLNFVTVKMVGNKKYIRTIKGDNIKSYFLEILKELEERGGDVKEEEFSTLLPFNFEDPEDQDKFAAPIRLMYSFPKLVELRVRITKKGRRFLMENNKQ